MALATVFLAIRFLYIKKKTEPAKNVVMTMASTAACWAVLAFIMVWITSSGLSKTCLEFEKRGACSEIFRQGFAIKG